MSTDKTIKMDYLNIEELKLPKLGITKIKEEEQEKVVQFVKRHGQKLPIIVDDAKTILQGAIIYEACKKLKIENVAVVNIGEISEDEIYQYTIAFKQISSMGELDFTVIEDKLKVWFLDDEPLFELEDLCISSIELDKMLFTSVFSNDENRTEEFSENPLEKIPKITNYGDLIRLGRHFLYCGDSKLESSFETCLQGKKADLIITDPPYGCKIKGNVTKQSHHQEFIEGSNDMDSDEFLNFIKSPITNLKTFSKENSLHYIFIDWRKNYDLQTICKNIYPKFINMCCWTKTQPAMGSFYRSQHELCFIYQNGQGKHTNNVQLGSNGRNRSNVWTYSGMNTATKSSQELRKLHSTVKPTAMIMDIIYDASDTGGIILDCFGGSGSTLIAAEQTGRKAYLIELNPRYCDVIIARWEALTGKKHKIVKGDM